MVAAWSGNDKGSIDPSMSLGTGRDPRPEGSTDVLDLGLGVGASDKLLRGDATCTPSKIDVNNAALKVQYKPCVPCAGKSRLQAACVQQNDWSSWALVCSQE